MIEVTIEGLAEALEKLTPDLYLEPLRRFYERAMETALNAAKVRAPVDTGRMRSSLARGSPGSIWEIDSAATPLWAKVGTNVNDSGFGYPRALDESSKYHYRGTPYKGQPTQGWFSDAFRLSLGEIERWLGVMKDEIVARWAH